MDLLSTDRGAGLPVGPTTMTTVHILLHYSTLISVDAIAYVRAATCTYAGAWICMPYWHIAFLADALGVNAYACQQSICTLSLNLDPLRLRPVRGSDSDQGGPVFRYWFHIYYQ
jgi:hypothetical protein